MACLIKLGANLLLVNSTSKSDIRMIALMRMVILACSS